MSAVGEIELGYGGPRELPARYADIVNLRRPDLLPQVFAPDVVWTVPGLEPIAGVAAASAALQALLEGYPHLLQMVGASVLRADGDAVVGRTAISEWGRDADGYNVQMIGVYTDRMVMTSVGWRFSERTFDFFHRRRSPGAGKFYTMPALPRQAPG
jgi:hypothetical protein